VTKPKASRWERLREAVVWLQLGFKKFSIGSDMQYYNDEYYI
jgi:hypothetical protein